MDFELPEDIRILRETVRKFVDRELIPIEMDLIEGPDLKPEVKASLEAKARELGLWQLDTPAEFWWPGSVPPRSRGGVGGGTPLNRAAQPRRWRFRPLPAPDPLASPREDEGALPLSASARRKIGSLRTDRTRSRAVTPGRMKTRAVRNGDHYIINGYKQFISHVKGADFLQLVAATDPEKGSRGGLSVFIVDMGTRLASRCSP